MANSTLHNVAISPPEPGDVSIGDYLIQRLQEYGIGHVFGIPGDYVLSFYTLLEQSPLETVGCTREDCAGFAADAYARVHGMGALCVTYCVGGLSVCNSIAGAYAEKSPVVMITGSPGLKERDRNPLLHHMVRNFRTQYDVFEKLCCAGTELVDPLTAFSEIDRVLATCARYKRPVYLDIPRDMVHVKPPVAPKYETSQTVSDTRALNEAVDETVRRIEGAKQPVIILGVEVHRFGLQDDVVKLAEASGIPMAATMLGKGVVAETHPLYMGLYSGALGREEITKYVEGSDCVLMLGTFMTDINLGIYTAELDMSDCILVTSEQLRIRHHHFHDVTLPDFVKTLSARKPRPKSPPPEAPTDFWKEPFTLRPDERITISRMIDRLDEQLDGDTVVIADVGDALFASMELTTRGRTEFLSPAYYTSMGFAVPAALGVHMAKPDSRVVAIVGDGAFQMTGMELSTLVRHKFATVVIVLDNGGYGTERLLHAGEWEFNDIHDWQFAKLPEVLGGGKGYVVRTESEFDAALNAAWQDMSGPSILQVMLDPQDCSRALGRMAVRMSKTVVQNRNDEEFTTQMAVAEEVMNTERGVLKKLAEQGATMDLSSIDIDPAWVYYPSALLFVALCVVAWLTSVFTLPGNWFVVALAAGFAWLFPEQSGRGIGWVAVGVTAGLAVLGEVIEFAAGAAGAAKQGASKRAVALSLVGALAGSLAGLMVGTPVPVIGSFVMALLGGAGGAFAGAYLGEMWKGREEDARIAAGHGAFVGKIWGTLGKLACGAVGIAVLTVDAFF